MWKSVLLPLLAAMAPTASARAADEINVWKGATLAGPGLAAHGYDVVAFFTEGKPFFRHVQGQSFQIRTPMSASAPPARHSARSSMAIRAFGISATAGSI
jgi:hypothetical protein